ncbi:MAG: nucleotidyltransferase domain-containing protein [Chloroflexi bacterium]|nr:nucleotidyltransferase domain-containing protein [Chloroflexota bacterium]
MKRTKSLRETKSAYRTRRAPAVRRNSRNGKRAIPTITPIGSDEPVSKTLPAAVRRIARELRPEKIILFGSYAYGNPNRDSDVDLLVVMRTRASRKERYLAVCRLLRPRPFAVDILVRTPQEIRHSLRGRDFFIQEVMSRGKVLYERPK